MKSTSLSRLKIHEIYPVTRQTRHYLNLILENFLDSFGLYSSIHILIKHCHLCHCLRCLKHIVQH